MDFKLKTCIDPDEFHCMFSQTLVFTTKSSPAKMQGYFKGNHLHSSTEFSVLLYPIFPAFASGIVRKPRIHEASILVIHYLISGFFELTSSS